MWRLSSFILTRRIWNGDQEQPRSSAICIHRKQSTQIKCKCIVDVPNICALIRAGMEMFIVSMEIICFISLKYVINI